MYTLFLNIHTPPQKIIFIFHYLKQLLDALWELTLVCFVDDANGFEVDQMMEFYCIQFDEERLCWFLKYEYCFVICFMCALPHRR